MLNRVRAGKRTRRVAQIPLGFGQIVIQRDAAGVKNPGPLRPNSLASRPFFLQSPMPSHMSESSNFIITYWGVTGTLSAPLRPEEVTDKLVEALAVLTEKGQLAHLAPGPNLEQNIRETIARELPFHLRSTYGGNTTCVEVQTPDQLIILDCGSGFRELGVSLDARWRAAGAAARRVAHVFVTHAHMDHTFATAFFTPYYNPQNSISIWGPQIVLDSLTAVLNPNSALSQLYFPPTYDQMKAIHEFRPVHPGADFMLGETRIKTYALHHPGGSMAYRLERGGRVYVFATDHEHQQVPDPGLAEFARDADVLYTEGQYTLEEYEGKSGVSNDPPAPRRGWGHSPMESCISTAVAANVKAVHVGHRDPRRSDNDLARLEQYMKELMADELRNAGKPAGSCEVVMPYEGLRVVL